MSHDFSAGVSTGAAAMRRLLPGLSREQADLAFATRRSDQARQRSRFAKACLASALAPIARAPATADPDAGRGR